VLFRRSSKVLLVDPDRRVLLLSGIDRTKPELDPWWFSVGGGLELGESPSEAAVRETYEETGLVIGDPGPVIFTRRFVWNFEGTEIDQDEFYFLVRTDHFEPSPAGRTALEIATIRSHRWWSIEEIRRTTEAVYPEDLADRLDAHLAM
jgi:8-oxo-dGTP pyrophosphatase MutT (NUDIX family)